MKTPWHLWVVALLALLWNAGGGFDYVMMQTGNPAYLAALTAAQAAYFAAFPAWVDAAWALGVWAALAGALLLFLRSRFAAPAFALSLLGMAANLVYGLALSDIPMRAVIGPRALAFSLAIVAVAILLWLYARRMTRAGVLR